jgi:hypothetical protein
MTDTQLLTLALSITLPIVLAITALIHSNSRVTDAKETLRAEMSPGFERTLNAIGQLKTELQSEIHQLRNDLEKHELLKRH